MSLEHATRFIQRLREDPEFRWALGACNTIFDRRRFVARSGYRFSSAELACASSPAGEASPERARRIERVRRAQGQPSFAFL